MRTEATPARMPLQLVLGQHQGLVGFTDQGIDAAAVRDGGVIAPGGIFVRQRDPIDGLAPVRPPSQAEHGLVRADHHTHLFHQIVNQGLAIMQLGRGDRRRAQAAQLLGPALAACQAQLQLVVGLLQMSGTLDGQAAQTLAEHEEEAQYQAEQHDQCRQQARRVEGDRIIDVRHQPPALIVVEVDEALAYWSVEALPPLASGGIDRHLVFIHPDDEAA
ncbi:hypothetical protein D9M69_297280 [compost metagenome]